MNDLWQIRLDSVVLEDGNYPDFGVGDRADFALQLYSDDLRPAPGLTASVAPVSDHTYAVVGSLERGPAISVLDLGTVKAYFEHRDEHPELHGLVAGQVTLSVDPFRYIESSFRDRRVPPLIYGWRIEGIAMVTGPVITVRPGDTHYPGLVDEGPRLIRDPERILWKPLDRTRMKNDESWYVLTCRLLDLRAQADPLLPGNHRPGPGEEVARGLRLARRTQPRPARRAARGVRRAAPHPPRAGAPPERAAGACGDQGRQRVRPPGGVVPRRGARRSR